MSEFSSIWDDLKLALRRRDNMIHQIIFVNAGVYILLSLLKLFIFLFQMDPGFYNILLREYLSVPASLGSLITHPWTILTYMFTHEGFFHILFNMLFLFWFGRILREYLGNQKILPVYILGGFSGAILYVISYNTFPVFAEALPISIALGASAGVFAIILAAATLLPQYSIHLLFFGAVKLRTIAFVAILIDLLQIPNGNAGGHIAHLGGMLFGFVFIKQMNAGNDMALWFNGLADRLIRLFTSNRSPRLRHKSAKASSKTRGIDQEAEKQEKVDKILDKISHSGYESLSAEEKEFLFSASNDDK